MCVCVCVCVCVRACECIFQRVRRYAFYVWMVCSADSLFLFRLRGASGRASVMKDSVSRVVVMRWCRVLVKCVCVRVYWCVCVCAYFGCESRQSRIHVFRVWVVCSVDSLCLVRLRGASGSASVVEGSVSRVVEWCSAFPLPLLPSQNKHTHTQPKEPIHTFRYIYLYIYIHLSIYIYT